MPLIDALRSGVDLANASNQGIITGAQARYAYPTAQGNLFKLQTENQYLPEQLRLANQYQGLINQYYGPEHQAAIDYQTILNRFQPEKSRLENLQTQTNIDYTPLKYAIEAENSMRNNSRFGGSYQYLKAIADLPAEQRSIYLGDPANNAQYMAMIQQLHDSLSDNSGKVSVLPPLLKKLGLLPLSSDILGTPAPKGVVVSPNQTGGLAAPLPQANNTQQPLAPSPQVPPVGGMAAPFSMPSVPGVGFAPPPNYTPIPMFSPNSMPQQNFGNGNAPPIPNVQGTPGPLVKKEVPDNAPPLTPQAATVAQNNGVSPQEANQVANEIQNPTLNPKEKQLLSFQMVANKKAVGQYITNRALGGVTLHSLLIDNQQRFASAFENASKYAGLLNSGKLTLDRFRQEHPKEYQDYMWVTQDLVPNISNNVKVMEGLSSTDTQREALNDMFKSVLRWDSDPKMAVNNINKTIELLKDQAEASLKTAQPVYPGSLEKLYGIKKNNTNYLGTSSINPQKKAALSAISTADLLKMYKGGK